MPQSLRILHIPRAVHEGCVMDKSAVIDTLKLGVASGCTEALFTFGERPEEEKGFCGAYPKGRV
jgi:hypothetical protein